MEYINKISLLINELKALVYAETEEQLIHLYSAVEKGRVTNKYPYYLEHIQTLGPIDKNGHTATESASLFEEITQTTLLRLE